MRRNAIIQLLVLAVVSTAGWLAVANAQDIRDWWVLRGYTPPAEIAELARRSAMNDSARRVFYASQPQLNGRDEFNTNCTFVDKSLVLGCYSDFKIYIFDVDDKRLDGIEEVTAAHEMLHAVYERLSSAERERLDVLTRQALDALPSDHRVRDIVSEYEKGDPLSVPNELHSILGTEVKDLPADLEAHYQLYFSDRSKLVSLAENYEAVFTGIEQKIAVLKTKLDGLAEQVETLTSNLTAQKNALDAESSRLSDLRGSDQISAYNAAVPGYNTLVAAYNADIESYKSLINEHNRLVKQYNELALTQTDLVQSINSKFQPI